MMSLILIFNYYNIKMDNLQKRIYLFLLGCIPLRLFFVYLAKNISKIYLPYLGILSLIPILGWLWILMGHPRNTGPEVLGGKIWWNHLRPIHITLYILFAYLALNKNKSAYIPLLIDVVIGLVAFVHHHFF